MFSVTKLINSVFLRMLERYDGLMFMTTNRRDSVDSAVASRIDIIMNFSELERGARSHIWSGFLAKVPDKLNDVKEHEMDILAKPTCNGREIKSTVKLCHALAEKNGKPVNVTSLLAMLQLKQGLQGE